MDNKSIPVTKIHSYNVSVAADVGINAAVIFYNICFWVEENTANNRNCVNGEYWTYNTVNAFNELFPEMTYEQIRNALRKLENGKYIKSAFLNEDTRDRTKWYTVCDKEKWIASHKSICENSHMDCDEKHMDSDESQMFNIYNNINNISDDKQSLDNQEVNKHSNNSHKEQEEKKGRNNSENCKAETSVSEKQKNAYKKSKYETYLELKEKEKDMLNRAYDICRKEHSLSEDISLEVVKIIDYYLSKYTQKTGNIHPILGNKALSDIISTFCDVQDTEYGHFENLVEDGNYMDIIDEFFRTDFGQRIGEKTDYHLSHFATDGVITKLAQRLI